MANIKKTNKKNLGNRAAKFVAHALESGDEGVKLACLKFDEMLDDLLGNDYFGTEGQCDPRGDRRD